MQIDTTSSANVGPPRKVTAVGVMGDVGQLFTVYEKNWKCVECGQENYATRPRCYRCRGHKPQGENNYSLDPALQAVQNGGTINWKEAIDPSSYQIYYYNTQTGETQWERPAEMGPAPHATGWFGRGKAGSMASMLYNQKNEAYLRRPARKQKEFIDPKKYHIEGANEFNIWYGRYLGDNERGAAKEKAGDRCFIDKDGGATKADITTNTKTTKHYFCIHFSHGTCAKGKDCDYYHRIPTLEDDAKCDELFDCFGRQRHNKHREDMTGTGSFMKPCRTLFVGGLLKHKYDPPQTMEEALWKNFGEWGEVEHINVIYRLSIAFVRYRVRTSAEFAKEAMMGQNLGKDEILDIRWAHDDPNPVAQDAIGRADKDALYALMKAKGISIENTGFQYPAEYQLPEAKRVRLDNGLDVIQQNSDLAYPNTDEQYHTSATTSATGTEGVNMYGMTPEQYAIYCAQYYFGGSSVSVGGDENKSAEVVTVVDSSNLNRVENSEKESEAVISTSASAVSDWVEYTDDDTGATYFYNGKTGESVWGTKRKYIIKPRMDWTADDLHGRPRTRRKTR